MSLLVDVSDIGDSFKRIKTTLDRASANKKADPNYEIEEADLEILIVEGAALTAGLLKDVRIISASLLSIANSQQKIAAAQADIALEAGRTYDNPTARAQLDY